MYSKQARFKKTKNQHKSLNGYFQVEPTKPSINWEKEAQPLGLRWPEREADH
jgi:hypothetical protein